MLAFFFYIAYKQLVRSGNGSLLEAPTMASRSEQMAQRSNYMLVQEIKVGGVYQVLLPVQFRNEREVTEVSLFVQVLQVRETFVEIIFLGSPERSCHFLEAKQLYPCG